MRRLRQVWRWILAGAIGLTSSCVGNIPLPAEQPALWEMETDAKMRAATEVNTLYLVMDSKTGDVAAVFSDEDDACIFTGLTKAYGVGCVKAKHIVLNGKIYPDQWNSVQNMAPKRVELERKKKRLARELEELEKQLKSLSDE